MPLGRRIKEHKQQTVHSRWIQRKLQTAFNHASFTPTACRDPGWDGVDADGGKGRREKGEGRAGGGTAAVSEGRQGGGTPGGRRGIALPTAQHSPAGRGRRQGARPQEGREERRGQAKREEKGGRCSQRMVWKKALGRRSKLSPSCSGWSSLSSGFAEPFMAPHPPVPSRPVPSFPPPAVCAAAPRPSGRRVQPGKRSGAGGGGGCGARGAGPSGAAGPGEGERGERGRGRVRPALRPREGRAERGAG